MKNAFERYGIEHLSHSSISMFAAVPSLWIIKYLMGFREKTNAAMARGHAVEHGIYVGLTEEFADPCEAAETEFLKLTALGVDGDSREKERKNIAGMVRQGIDALVEAKVGPVTGYQDKVSIELEGVPVPLIGFTDITFEGKIVDVKSTTRCPSAISAAHRRQGAIYQKANGNHAIQFLYTTPTKVGYYTLENSEQDLEEVRQAAMTIERVLNISNDPAELAGLFVPNLDMFYYNSPAVRAEVKKVYGY